MQPVIVFCKTHKCKKQHIQNYLDFGCLKILAASTVFFFWKQVQMTLWLSKNADHCARTLLYLDMLCIAINERFKLATIFTINRATNHSTM